jgi:hypothetical protein
MIEEKANHMDERQKILTEIQQLSNKSNENTRNKITHFINFVKLTHWMSLPVHWKCKKVNMSKTFSL